MRWLIAFIAIGCGTDEPDEPSCIQDLVALHGTDIANARVDVGSGRDTFEDLTADGQILLIHGPQGGYHLLLNALVYDMQTGDPLDYSSGPLTVFSVHDDAGNRLDQFTCAIRYPYVPSSGDGFQLDRSLAVILPNDLVPGIYGRRVRVRAEVLDRGDRYGFDEVEVVVTDPESL